jgi:hypothetical protein
MARIAILERSDMNAEQARVYDAAKQSSGIVGGPYYAYIRLPKLFEACQNLHCDSARAHRSRQHVNGTLRSPSCQPASALTVEIKAF